MKSYGAILASPVLCLLLLGGMVAQQRTRLKPDDPVVRNYHARAEAAIKEMPWGIKALGADWSAEERKPETAAVRLLKPNAILSRHYVQIVSSGRPLTADLLIVQCRDSRDMTGHYPPICYKNIGYELVHRAPRGPIQVGNERVTYTEYHFEKYSHGRQHKVCVFNFFVVPGRGVVADIKGVHEAAEDYERRFFGAAQFQVLMPVEMMTPRAAEVRQEVFAALLRSHAGLIGTLKSDGLSQ
jgi:hypothetical protein